MFPLCLAAIFRGLRVAEAEEMLGPVFEEMSSLFQRIVGVCLGCEWNRSNFIPLVGVVQERPECIGIIQKV